MEDFIKWLTPYTQLLQTLSFVITIITAVTLTIVGIKGLRQLKLAKDTLKTQSHRDARRITADYVYKYLTRIIDYIPDKTPTEKQKRLLRGFYSSSDGKKGYIDIKKVNLNDPKIELNSRSAREEYTISIKRAASAYSGLLNELEAFCSVIASGILDERTLYRAVGQSFLRLIDDAHLAHFIHLYSMDNNLYTNVTEIYDIWATRRTLEELQKVEDENKDLSVQIESLKSDLKQKRRAIEPIGTED